MQWILISYGRGWNAKFLSPAEANIYRAKESSHCKSSPKGFFHCWFFNAWKSTSTRIDSGPSLMKDRPHVPFFLFNFGNQMKDSPFVLFNFGNQRWTPHSGAPMVPTRKSLIISESEIDSSSNFIWHCQAKLRPSLLLITDEGKA